MPKHLPQIPPTQDESTDFMLAVICRLHHARAHVHLESIGLSRGQPPLITLLHHQEGLTHGELAARLSVTPATMTKMIQRMERAGFVQRRPDASDQRISRVYLTDAGRMVRIAMVDALARLEAETFAGISDEELWQLRRLFGQIQANLLRVTEEGELAGAAAEKVA